MCRRRRRRRRSSSSSRRVLRRFLSSLLLNLFSVPLTSLASQHVLRVAQRFARLGKIAQLLDFFTIMTPSHLLLRLVSF